MRTAKRVAERRASPWVAVYVETSHHGSLSEQQKDRIAQTMRLAEQLGGETVTLQGEDVAAEVLAFAEERNASQIIVGRQHRSGWRRLFGGGSVTARILAKAEAFEVLLVGGEETEKNPPTFDTKAAPQPWNGWPI